ncbi:hypothetical protein B0H10DRAFT_1951329 [Mycena sp. CBHHK59/15]|nr:hypothetical protein B0H10DRAFT_1951329 [Mycena sp. CBHHK59/15]
MPSIDDLVDPPEEHLGDVEEHQFANDGEIVAQVWHKEAVAHGDFIEIDNDSEDEVNNIPEIGTTEILKLCRTLESVCLSKGDPGQSMELNRALRLFRGHVQWEELTNARQLTLMEAWGTKSNA